VPLDVVNDLNARHLVDVSVKRSPPFDQRRRNAPVLGVIRLLPAPLLPTKLAGSLNDLAPARGPASGNRHSFHKGVGRSARVRAVRHQAGKCKALRRASAAAKASSLNRICSNMRITSGCGVTRNGVTYRA
jgi:hypothetical protein